MSRSTVVPRTHRRQFLQQASVLSAGVWLGSSASRLRAEDSPNEKLNVACVGIGGRGSANLGGVSKENIVALCDVDDQRAGKAYDKFPKAKKYYDYRQMLDEMHGQIDAVVVSTPDHTHFHPTWAAMQLDKHVYVEKPLAHNVWECRELTKLAAEKKLATQLGTQRHTIDNVHRVVELIQSNAIGDVLEVHSWVGGSRGMPKVPTEFPEVPAHLKWDLWLGPTAKRPYSPAFAPYNWRFWWDYGTGETGNWGCHILDIPFWALDLKYPTRVYGSGPEPHPLTTPKSMTTRFDFPVRGSNNEVTLHWYHGTPPILKELNLSGGGMNNLFIGSEGMLLCGFGSRKLLPEEKFADFKAPEKTIPNSPGFHKEWIQACKGGPAATCNFDYTGPMAEAVLLGNVAYRAQGEFEWDAETLSTGKNERAQQYIREEFRQGWEI